jgi:hypothetical protein
LVALHGTEDLDEWPTLAGAFAPGAAPAYIAVRFGSQKNLYDSADHGFALVPGSRVERRREILSVGMLRQESAGHNVIDESAIVGGMDQFAGGQHPDQIRQKSAKRSGGQRAGPDRIGSPAGKRLDHRAFKRRDPRLGAIRGPQPTAAR